MNEVETDNLHHLLPRIFFRREKSKEGKHEINSDPDGKITSRDGKITSRDWKITTRDGKITSRDGKITSRDWRTVVYQEFVAKEI